MKRDRRMRKRGRRTARNNEFSVEIKPALIAVCQMGSSCAVMDTAGLDEPQTACLSSKIKLAWQ